jgi:hypothetical protein
MWVCSHKTWNPTSFVMSMKTSQITSWDVVISPPWGLTTNHKCNVLDWKPDDGGGLI